MKVAKLKVRRIFKENRNPYKSSVPNSKTLLSNAHAPNIVCELNPSPEPMKHYKPVLASRQNWMTSLDRASKSAAASKINRSAHTISPSTSLKPRSANRMVLNKSQNLVTFDERKPLAKDEAKNLMTQLEDLKEAVKLVQNKDTTANLLDTKKQFLS